jgi:hypothetical protein
MAEAFLRVASQRSVVRRALAYAVVVGGILIAINRATCRGRACSRWV